MNYYEEIPTLQVAAESMTVEELKKLAALTGEKMPVRKADIAALIVKHLAGDGLRSVWEGLDEWQRAAVAEAVHSPSSQFEAGVFRAKYGRDPDWGRADKYGRREPSALCLFFHQYRVIPADLKERLLTFVPKPRETTIATLDELPPVYDRPFVQWNTAQRTREEGTEEVPLTVHETERSALRELLY